MQERTKNTRTVRCVPASGRIDPRRLLLTNTRQLGLDTIADGLKRVSTQRWRTRGGIERAADIPQHRFLGNERAKLGSHEVFHLLAARVLDRSSQVTERT